MAGAVISGLRTSDLVAGTSTGRRPILLVSCWYVEPLRVTVLTLSICGTSADSLSRHARTVPSSTPTCRAMSLPLMPTACGCASAAFTPRCLSSFVRRRPFVLFAEQLNQHDPVRPSAGYNAGNLTERIATSKPPVICFR
jgi:hypothetical protein